MSDSTTYLPVSLLKRLLAIVYDLFLLIAICFMIAAIISIFTTFLLNGGNAITAEHPYYLLNQILMLSSIFITGVLFYVWFWSHGGQTLGMKTWMLCLVSDDGSAIDRKQATIRCFAAVLSWSVFGAGFLWSLIDSRKRTWHDILSKSHLVQLEKK
jgi:uncharacterized RDD family membrane protein YckC